MTTRTRIRVCLFSTVALILSVGWIVRDQTTNAWHIQLENQRQSAWLSFSAHLSEMETALNQMMYTRSLPQQTELASTLAREAECAKLAWDSLTTEPIPDVDRFLAQTGDYARAATTQTACGTDCKPEWQSLYRYACALNGSVQDAAQADAPFDDTLSAFRDAADNLNAYEALIYDGAYSDCEDSAEPGADCAEEAAKTFIERGKLSMTCGDSESPKSETPCRVWADDTHHLTVAQSGEIQSYRDTREIGEARLSPDEATRIAEQFLTDEGYSAVLYDSDCDGTVHTLTFIGSENGMRCYTDRMIVSVALDTGDIVGFFADCRAHEPRTVPETALSAEDAQALLHESLTVTRPSGLAVMPTAGGDEVYCHEFICTGVNGETVAVYLDAQDGHERAIRIYTECPDCWADAN